MDGGCVGKLQEPKVNRVHAWAQWAWLDIGVSIKPAINFVTLIECAAKKLQYLIIEGENPVMA